MGTSDFMLKTLIPLGEGQDKPPCASFLIAWYYFSLSIYTYENMHNIYVYNFEKSAFFLETSEGDNE